MSASHSSLSPSSAERWNNCPGSVQLSATVPAKPSSPAAAEGTATHTLSESLVTNEATEADLRKKVGQRMRTWDSFEVLITDEMVDGAVLYHKTILALITEFGDGPVVARPEVKVIASSIDSDVRGTADYVIYRKDGRRRLVVTDFKFGKKAVNPVENKQLGIYLVGAMDSLAKSDDFDEMELVVVQPRAGGKVVRRWIVPMSWVIQFRQDMRKAVAATRAKNPRLSAGNWCFFCPVKGVKRQDGSLACPEIAKELQRQAHIDFAEFPVTDAAPLEAGLPDPRKLAAIDIAKILSWESVIESWLKDLRERAKEMREDGLDVPGFKLVESRTHRQWAKPEDEVAGALALMLDSDELYDMPAIKSVAQVEKLLGKGSHGVLEKLGLVTKPDGDTIIVSADDSREEVGSTAIEDFAPIAGIEELLGLPAPAPREVVAEVVERGTATDSLLAELMEEKPRGPIWPV